MSLREPVVPAAGTTVHAFAGDVLGDQDAVGIAARLRSGEIGAVEVIEAAISRIEQVNPHLNAVQVEAFERARARARETRGAEPFAGVPTLIKDNVDVAGLPTAHGSAAFKPRPAKRDWPPAKQYLAQGFTLLGKSTMPEFGLTASTEYADRPPTRNPWDTGRSAGASSGGSGALVAAGAVPIAHANDGGGSIRIPAAANGLVGLKPSRGRVLDQPGANLLPVNIAAEGALTRTVRDAAHHLAAMERTHRNPRLPGVGLVERPGDRRLRIGVITETVVGPVDPEVVAGVREAADLLADLGHQPVEMPLPVDEQFAIDFRAYWGFFAVVLSANSKLHRPGGFSVRKLDPFTRAMAGAGLRRAHAWPAVFRRLRRVAAVYDALFSGIDLVLSPVVTRLTPEIGYLKPTIPFEELFARTAGYAGFTAVQNVSGGPAISVPFGLSPEGLPRSIQLAGRVGTERALLEVSYELEQARPFPRIQDRLA